MIQATKATGVGQGDDTGDTNSLLQKTIVFRLEEAGCIFSKVITYSVRDHKNRSSVLWDFCG